MRTLEITYNQALTKAQKIRGLPVRVVQARLKELGQKLSLASLNRRRWGEQPTPLPDLALWSKACAVPLHDMLDTDPAFAAGRMRRTIMAIDRLLPWYQELEAELGPDWMGRRRQSDRETWQLAVEIEVRLWREVRGLSYEQLSKRCAEQGWDVGSSVLHRICTAKGGKQLDVDELNALARAFGHANFGEMALADPNEPEEPEVLRWEDAPMAGRQSSHRLLAQLMEDDQQLQLEVELGRLRARIERLQRELVDEHYRHPKTDPNGDPIAGAFPPFILPAFLRRPSNWG